MTHPVLPRALQQTGSSEWASCPGGVLGAGSDSGRGQARISKLLASGGGQRRLRPGVLMETEPDGKGRISDRLFQKTARHQRPQEG